MWFVDHEFDVDGSRAAEHKSRRVAVLVDEGEDLTLRLEVNSMAFFKRSCSICRRSYAFLILRSSEPLFALCGRLCPHCVCMSVCVLLMALFFGDPFKFTFSG